MTLEEIKALPSGFYVVKSPYWTNPDLLFKKKEGEWTRVHSGFVVFNKDDNWKNNTEIMPVVFPSDLKKKEIEENRRVQEAAAMDAIIASANIPTPVYASRIINDNGFLDSPSYTCIDDEI